MFGDGGKPDHRDALPALRLQDEGHPQHSSTWGNAATNAPLPMHGLRVHGTSRRPCTGGKEAVTEMPVEVNGPRAAVDAPHNMKAPTQPGGSGCIACTPRCCPEKPPPPTEWPAKQVPQQMWRQHKRFHKFVGPGPIACPEREVRPAPPRRSGVIMIISIGFIFAAAAVAVISISPHLSLLEAGDRRQEGLPLMSRLRRQRQRPPKWETSQGRRS